MPDEKKKLLDDAGVVEAAIRAALFRMRCDKEIIEAIIERLRGSPVK